MRDIKYIIKRVIIGVAIVLVLGFLNGCKVKALPPNIDDIELIKNIYFNSNCEILDSYNRPTDKGFGLYYSPSLNRYYIAFASDTNGTPTSSYYLNNADSLPYISILLYQQSGSSLCDVKFNFTASPIYYNATDYINGDSIFPGAGYIKESGYDAYASISSTNSFNMNNNSHNITSYKTVSFNSDFNMNLALINNNTYRKLLYTNYDAKDLKTNTVFHQRDIEWNPNEPIVTVPKIESLQAHKNIKNGILFSYQFSPKFSIFDTNNYKYQWKLGRDSSWNDFDENEQLLNFKQDGELYFRIVDISNNTVVDNENFVIHGIGQATSSSIFNINFSSTYSSSSDDSSKLGITVEEVKVDISFYPESDKYRYQYKFVPTGTSQSDVIWTTSATSNISYTTTENGTIYARITDTDYNSLFDKTYVINNIGTIAPGFDSKSSNNFFSNISSNLNFTGPISSLINIPLKLISTIADGVAGGLTCHDYPLGSLWGTSLVLPCVNIRQRIGNSLYTTIDLIIACCMIYNIIKMFGELYTNLLFMNKNPIYDLGKRGD